MSASSEGSSTKRSEAMRAATPSLTRFHWAAYVLVALAAMAFADVVLDALAGAAASALRVAAFRVVLVLAFGAPIVLALLRRRLDRPIAAAPALPRPRWLSPRLALIALSLAAALGGLATFELGREIVARTMSRHLEGITRLKAHVLDGWVHETGDDIAFFVATPHFIEGVQRWQASGMRDARERTSLLESMSAMRTTGHYLEMSLRDAHDGALLLSTGSESDSPAVRSEAVASARSGETLFEDFHAEPERGALIYVGFFVPVVEPKLPQPRFVMHVAIDPAHSLFPLLQQWPGAPGSAELLLMRRDGDAIVMLNELRTRPHPDLLMRIPLTRPQFFAAPLARGTEGVLEGLDDEGTPVLGHGLDVAGLPWFVVAKVDKAEAYAELVTISLLAASLVGALLLLGAWWWVEQHRHVRASLRLQVERDLLSRRVDFLAQYANDCIVRWDAAGNVLEVNDRCLSTYGYSLPEILHMNLTDLHAPEARPAMADKLRRLAEQGSLVYETRHRRKDGRVLPVEVSARLIEIDGQRTVQAIIRDVSERKRLEAERAEHARRLAELSRRVVSAQEDERRRLSRDLHDRTGANLASVGLNLSSVDEALPPEATAGRGLLKEARALLAETIVSIREFCADLRPALLDYAGLLPALDNLAQQFGRRTGAAVRFECEEFAARCTPEAESVLYRIAQEALTNCAKHARANTVVLRLEERDGRCRMQIADDGCGFDPAALGQSGEPVGQGLLNMRERAEFAGGRFTLISQPGHGTLIEVELDAGGDGGNDSAPGSAPAPAGGAGERREPS